MAVVIISCSDVAQHEHSYGDKWEYDETNHWHVCVYGENTEAVAHTLETTKAKVATCTEKGWDEYVTCTVVSTGIKQPIFTG